MSASAATLLVFWLSQSVAGSQPSPQAPWGEISRIKTSRYAPCTAADKIVIRSLQYYYIEVPKYLLDRAFVLFFFPSFLFHKVIECTVTRRFSNNFTCHVVHGPTSNRYMHART